MQIKKILIIRFSSIGDIVLTTPIIRCAKKQLIGTEIHFVTKEVFRNILSNNPNIDKLHTFKDDVSEIYEQLKSENFDVIIDLHKNLRSLRLKQKLKVKRLSQSNYTGLVEVKIFQDHMNSYLSFSANLGPYDAQTNTNDMTLITLEKSLLDQGFQVVTAESLPGWIQILMTLPAKS